MPQLDGASILITGGTGSFGVGLVRTVLSRFNIKRLIVFSRDEWKQSDMALEFSPQKYPCLRYFIGDVRDVSRLEMALQGVNYVVHAAALKQVPAAEYNPIECINTNVLGAENLVQASLRCGVKKIVALSTDKAANPINLYGASKLASDKIFVAANNLSGADGPKFCVVRYGNVIGSRGSVMPLFQKIVEQGGEALPITDARMTRFWITLQQGVNFVLSSLELMSGGEIFVPKIPSMRVVDIATAIAPQLPHVNVGIRPGEKLHEIMIPADDARTTLELSDRYVIRPAYKFWARPDAEFADGRPVPEGFSYASNTNTEWLTPDQLRTLKATV